jgi:transcriptional antiterminator NusG
VRRNTAGVTGFVGVGSDPSPLEDDEVRRLLGKVGLLSSEDKNIDLGYGIGDTVEIKEGAFLGRVGEVSEIDYEHQFVKVMVDLFGRMTPVEIAFDGVEKR